MKREILLKTLAICLSGTLITGTSFAKDPNAEAGENETKSETSISETEADASTDAGGVGQSTTKSTGYSAGSHKSMRVSKLMDASVKNAQGETLGELKDLVVNPMARKIDFAIISVGDDTSAEKLTAVPWALVRPGSSPGEVMVNVDKQKFESAQTFEESSWPDFSQPNQTAKIYSHYGIVVDTTGTGGRIQLEGIDSGKDEGIDVNEGRTAPDGKGTFDKGTENDPNNPSSPPQPE